MKKFIAVSMMIFITFLPELLMAHPGHEGEHGDSGYTITHYFTQPSHIIVTIVSIVAVVAFVRYTKRSTQNK
jgi:hypothetical protein